MLSIYFRKVTPWLKQPGNDCDRGIAYLLQNVRRRLHRTIRGDAVMSLLGIF
ncbi:hypothetical protein KCP78_18110 [Salmonella enterica subsp. enterica]|nr:hypothetical protein KCP78_18110 [Salmonella enterica subsp. enterica]